MSSSQTMTHAVEALNTAPASENRIHDDETAQRFGFHGGLVPGVEVYAYMAHMPVERFGRAWLERGGLECRFQKPVYDGRKAIVSAREDAEGLELGVRSDGVDCATGRAWLGAVEPAPDRDALRGTAPAVDRPAADHASLPVGRALGIAPVTIGRAELARYLDDVRETHALYAQEELVHPGQILRLANAALMQNVVLGPWIHVGSRVQNFAAARLCDRLTLNTRISANREHKGHDIVELDALVVANEAAVVASIHHVAIWRPRQISSPVSSAPLPEASTRS